MAQNIRKRAYEFALNAISIFRELENKKDGASKILGKQFLRSATSIGANIEEAQSGESKADFIHKYSIAQKEARESLYWLRLVKDSQCIQESHLKPLLDEIDELISIITAIIVNTKNRC